MLNRTAVLARRSGGATMIEVLVALFVLSVGLLGVAAMQQVSLRGSTTAHLRAQATALAYDIADRMRANRDQAYANPSPYALPVAAPTPASTCTGTTSADQVTCDLNRWRTLLAQTLPNGTGGVAIAAPVAGDPLRVATITVQWGERDDTGAVQPRTFTTQTQL